MIGITIGDPAGIGLETLRKALNHLQDSGVDISRKCLLIGPESLCRKSMINLPVVWDQEEPDPDSIVPGIPSKLTGRMAFESINLAVDLLEKGSIHSLLTLPVSKEWICHGTGMDFTGHTEYLANRSGARDFGMLLANSLFSVYLMTTHIPIRKVSESITGDLLETRIQLLLDHVQQMDFLGPARFSIAVCGLNPHSGENGAIGMEETRIIIPAINKLNARNDVQIMGPFPADTVFLKALRKEIGIVVCMYHDQALIPLKTTDPENAVNITVGLPYLRTSPGHGTAFDIAGLDIADFNSTLRALTLNIKDQGL